jgi:lysophospholipase L1-like esterase
MMKIDDEVVGMSRLNEGNKNRLAEKFLQGRKRPDRTKKNDITVAFIGGSITQRFDAEEHNCYARLVYDWFKEAFPAANVIYVNAGVGATGSYIGVHRVDTDVISHRPDFVFVEFSVNDTTDNLERDMDAYDSLLRKLWNCESQPAIIAVAMTEKNGDSFQEYHRKIVRAYKLPMLSYRDAVLYAIGNRTYQWSDLATDDIHPNATGHHFLASLIINFLQETMEGAGNETGLFRFQPDLAKPFTTDKYAAATLIRPEGCGVGGENANLASGKIVNSEGCKSSTAKFGNMDGYFLVKKELVFEVNCRNIGILYGKLLKDGGDFVIYVDDQQKAKLSADFSGGWGNYIEAEEVISEATARTHIVKIVNTTTSKSPDSQGKKRVLITALAIS